MLLSCKHWPLVYAVDMAVTLLLTWKHAFHKWQQQSGAIIGDALKNPAQEGHHRYKYVAVLKLCILHYISILLSLILQIVHLPELKNIHSKPVTTSNITSEHNYAKNLVHPLTLTMGRYVVGDRFHDGPTSSSHRRETCKYHNMRLCPELTQFQSVTSEVINSKIKSTRLQSSSQQNIYHYYFYNRLMDHWHNLKVVNKQLTCMKGGMKPGETIARDELHRFVYVCALCKKQGHDSTSCFNY